MSVALATDYRYSHTVGIYQMAGRGFSHPVDMALDQDGAIYVVNRGNPTQASVAVRVSVITVNEEDLGQFCGFGSGDGQMMWPTAIAIDREGRIYIADEHRQDVQVFDKSREFLFKWGTFGGGEGEINRPSGLAFDPEDNLLVVDHLNHRVQKFTREGQPLARWGSSGSGPGELNLPWGITIGGQDDVYVADWGNDRVQKFSPDGRHLATFGTSGRGGGQLWRPSGVAVDARGNVCVADRGNDRIQIYSGDGAHIGTLEGDAVLSKWAEVWLEGNADIADQRKLVADRELEKRFWVPTAVKVDAEGRLLVLDTNRHRIQVYAPASD